MEHTYEEIRQATLDVLAGREKVEYEPSQFSSLGAGVAEVLLRRDGTPGVHGRDARLEEGDSMRFMETFWDLFLQRVISIGLDSRNEKFPWFHVTPFGKKMLDGGNPYFFHDVSTYEKCIRESVPNIDDTTLLYMKEAMQSFRSGCMLSATVMIGVATEHTFLSLLDAACKSRYGGRFAKAAKERSMLGQCNRFTTSLEQISGELPSATRENLATDFQSALHMIRSFRNESGHPTGKIIPREQTYVLLQVFIPCCKKMYELMEFFNSSDESSGQRA